MTRYSNPWSSYKKITPAETLSSLSLNLKGVKKTNERIPITHQAKFPTNAPKEDEGPKVMWLGHASTYLLLPVVAANGGREWRGILFDPVFSKRCSPINFLGPKRRLNVPCQIEDLPRVDLVFISHDHYDHLDKASIISINEKHPNAEYFVPKGVKPILTKFGVNAFKISEMGWWDEQSTVLTSNKKERLTSELRDERTVHMSSSSPTKSQTSISDEDYQHASPLKEPEIAHDEDVPLSPKSFAEPITLTSPRPAEVDHLVKVVCCPAQHNSGRNLFGKKKTLWCTWWIEYGLPNGVRWKCLFGGDTGYRSQVDGPSCPIFREMKDRLGSPDLALLPISHGSVLPYLSSLLPFIKFDSQRLTSAIHCSPYDAIVVHQEIGARVTIPIHWGTWTTEAGAVETIQKLRESCERRNVNYGWYDNLGKDETSDGYSGVIVSDVGITIPLDRCQPKTEAVQTS